VVGIAGVIIAVITYVVSTFPQLRRIVAWRESIKVLSFDQNAYTFANEGDGELFLSEVVIRHRLEPSYDSEGTETDPIRQIIMPGSILSGKFENRHGTLTGEILSGVPNEKWIGSYYSAVSAFEEGCIHRQVLARDDPGFKTVSNVRGDQLRTFVVEAKLNYYSLHNRAMQSKTFDAVGILVRSNDSKCADKK
jgi:hypothetical protein